MQARLVLLAGGCGAMALGVALVAPAPVTATQKSVHDLPREELLAIIDQVVKADRAKGNDGTGKPRGAPQAATSPSFWNWETPHVHPIELTPDGSTLLAVNTADGRLEVFSAAGADLVAVASIPVGVDPVTVRVRSNTEAWVCNHLSDSISIVDLPTRRVRATLSTGDEPCDVVFAGTPARAFVSVSQLNEVRVFDPVNLAAAPTVLSIQGEDPRGRSRPMAHASTRRSSRAATTRRSFPRQSSAVRRIHTPATRIRRQTRGLRSIRRLPRGCRLRPRPG